MEQIIEFKTKTTDAFSGDGKVSKDQFVGKAASAEKVIDRLGKVNNQRTEKFAAKLTRGSVLIQLRW